MVWIVLGAMMFFVLLVPQHAYGATQCPATREECQSFIDILVDSYVEEVGADNEAVYVVGPEPVFDLASGDPVFSGTQCWSVYCCDETGCIHIFCRDRRRDNFHFVYRYRGNTCRELLV